MLSGKDFKGEVIKVQMATQKYNFAGRGRGRGGPMGGGGGGRGGGGGGRGFGGGGGGGDRGINNFMNCYLFDLKVINEIKFILGPREDRGGGGGGGGGGGFGGRDGDWKCGNPSCGNTNFSWRQQCNRCGEDKPSGAGGGGGGPPGGRGGGGGIKIFKFK